LPPRFNFAGYEEAVEYGFFGLDKKPELVNYYGSSRNHIFDAVDASLKRLDADYIDLYQLQRLDKVRCLIYVTFFEDCS
jgi:aryl-alcohol dehydrogenase-like predicted oxidoreductase